MLLSIFIELTNVVARTVFRDVKVEIKRNLFGRNVS